jgi:hypothetical protein
MKNQFYYFFAILSIVFTVSCSEKSIKLENNSIQLNRFDEFEIENHFKSTMSKQVFDSLHSWEFASAIIDPVLVMIQSTPFELQRVKRLAAGQKALYFFLKTDQQVDHGGFVQFYWNGFEGYIPPLREGLSLIKDKKMLKLIEEVDTYYQKNKQKFEKAEDVEAFNALYDDCPAFKKMTENYKELREVSVKKLEQYVKNHPDEFVVFE